MVAGASVAQDQVEDARSVQEETEATSSESSDEADAKDPDKEIRCKAVRAVNSRIPTRVCLSNEEWEEREHQTMEDYRRTRNRNSQCGTVRC